MGTGNDGSDGRELSDSLSRLTGRGAVAVQPVLRVIPSPGGPVSLADLVGRGFLREAEDFVIIPFLTHDLAGESYNFV